MLSGKSIFPEGQFFVLFAIDPLQAMLITVLLITLLFLSKGHLSMRGGVFFCILLVVQIMPQHLTLPHGAF